MQALHDEKSKFTSSVKESEFSNMSESIIANMYFYWKLRMKNAKSVDEGADCLINSGKSAERFRELIDQSMGIKTEEEKEADAIAKSPNVVFLRDE
jgi:hypothetical protein